MTPREKARELVDNFYDIDSDAEMYDDFKMPIFYAQRCALIAVDVIIKTHLLSEKNAFGIHPVDYWQEVKQEIELL
jgi:hypothetical protein